MNITSNLHKEVSLDIPEVAGRFLHLGKPLLVAYDCLLFEHFTDKNYVYTAANIYTKRTAIICKRKHPLLPGGDDAIIEKIGTCPVAGFGCQEIDMPTDRKLSRDKLAEILRLIFEEVLPQHGYCIRENQVELAQHIMEAITHRKISLSEAEVGIGKTLAYLIAAVLVKRSRVNDFWYRGHYPEQSYADSAHMPVVISTSSIALQKAIARDFIPTLSRILMKHGIIREPLRCVIRKGKEHYCCPLRLESYYSSADKITRARLEPLMECNTLCGLDGFDGLTAFDKRKICVQWHCRKGCPHKKTCRYQQHANSARSNKHDFQVCNHNYFLADIIRRNSGQPELIPHYQAVIIDEGHKFMEAAQQMYGVEFCNDIIPGIVEDISAYASKHGKASGIMNRLMGQLIEQNKRLFKMLENGSHPPNDDEASRFHVEMNASILRNIRSIGNIAKELADAISAWRALTDNKSYRSYLIYELKLLIETTERLNQRDEQICWLEKPDVLEASKTIISAAPMNLNNILYRDIWKQGLPIILTSGTLSASGSFERTKHKLGLNNLSPFLVEATSKPSPFDYQNNTMLYISEETPFPDIQDKEYIEAITKETEQLIQASHGHAAVLFTSYRAMDMVYKQLDAKGLPYPMFRMDKAGHSAINQFRKSGNGVLFAAGSLWEGIDLPGDILSMLIIVKLPFAVPDPINDYEKAQYRSFREYKDGVIVPDMLIKLKQGFGRLIRSETDTGVVALLDSRVATGSIYRKPVLDALPECPVTGDILQVEDFFRDKKGPEYFQISTCSRLGNKLAEG